MAYRVFPSGQVPTAEVLQKYLMNQVVITCTAAARPPTPVDGMTIFETDTGVFRVWSGGIWARLAHAGAWSDSGGLVVPGGLNVSGGGATVTGNVSATGNVSGVDVSGSGDVSARGSLVSRVVKGKVVGSSTDTSSASTTPVNIASGNVQNVPVIAGHAYRATYQIGVGGTLTNDRARFNLWNGTVGGTQLGSQEPLYRVTLGAAGGSFEAIMVTFVWSAPSTTTIANVNLAIHRFSGTGTVYARVESVSFAAVIEDLGLASTISGL